MFKLLIVDDEASTREGILERLLWSEMNIGQVEEASNGVTALKVIETFQPDIVLTDLRMPRMDGLEMSKKIKLLNPDCKIIFMSGYSDKEYLMSAIQLRVVNYVEKPINIEQLKSAINQAVEMCLEDKKKRNAVFEMNLLQSTGIPLLKNELTLRLIQNNPDLTLINDLIKRTDLAMSSNCSFVSVLFRIFSESLLSFENLQHIKNSINTTLEKLCINYNYNMISALKDDGYVIVILYINSSNKHLFTNEKIINFCREALILFEEEFKFFISIGKPVQEFINIHESYETSVLAIQKSYYRGYNNIINYNETSFPPFVFDSKIIKDFADTLINNNHSNSVLFIKQLSSSIKRCDNTLINNVQNLYCLLSMEINKATRFNGLTLEEVIDEQLPLQVYFKTNTINELENLLLNKLELFYEQLNEINESSGTISKIYKYIKSNYSDSNLSIKTISNYTHLAPTYICSIFKDKTGKTLNQYITEYRIEKAKALLSEDNFKMAQIANLIGCRDGNYFTKLFRKATGLTPTEYRERNLL